MLKLDDHFFSIEKPESFFNRTSDREIQLYPPSGSLEDRSDAHPLTDWGARLRPMRPEDVEQVAAIEKRNFRDAWTRHAFLAEIASSPVSQPLVAVYNDRIVGYVVPWYVADEMQIANLAVHEDFRRRGLGRRLLMYICEEAQRRGCRVAHLEVRRSNSIARRFYESLGFKETGMRRNYYGHNEEALLMSKALYT